MEKKTCLIEPQEANARLDCFLKDRESGYSRTQIQHFILDGRVLVNGLQVKPHYKLKAGDKADYEFADASAVVLTAEIIPLDIVFEDGDVLVLNKPSGMVAHPGAGNQAHTLVNALLAHTAELSTIARNRPGIVHRLDKDTSGLMVVAKNNPAHLNLAGQFRRHSIKRRYIALVEGKVEFDEGVIDVPLKRDIFDRKKIAVSWTQDARPAHTLYKVLKRYPGYSALELFPKTGRTHQLRVHLAYLGHPILGDPVYGRGKNFTRLALHAKNLGFNHPSTGEFMEFESPLPPEMKAALPGLKI